MKLKYSNCGTVVTRRKDVFDYDVKTLDIDPEDYKLLYLCRHCRQYPYFDWETISSNPKLLRYLDLIKYKTKLSWRDVCQYQKLTEEFIEKYKDYIDWAQVCEHQKLSEPFIEKYKDKVNWLYVSYYQKLSEPFIEKYKDKVDWNGISKSQKLICRIRLKIYRQNNKQYL